MGSNEVFTCPGEGRYDVNLSAYKGTVMCPPVADFCHNMAKKCPYDCSGNGLCMENGTCQCLSGFSGKDCNTCSNCKKETDPFVLETEEKKSDDDKKEDEKEKEKEEEKKEDKDEDTEKEEEDKEKEDEKKDEDEEKKEEEEDEDDDAVED